MTVSTVDGTVLRIVGTVDIASTATLRDALVSLAPDLSAGGELVLDAAEIDFIDAAGLGVLVEAHGRLADSGAVLRLTCVSARFRRLLRITSLEHLMAT